MLTSALKASVVVGTVLTVLNHGDQLIKMQDWPASFAWKVPLTYLVPFCVTLYGAMTQARR